MPAKVNVEVYGSDLRLGDDLVFYADLEYGDKLSVSDYSVRYANGGFLVSIEEGAIAATSADGRDVTDSYEFHPQNKTLSVIKRQMTITMPTVNMTYDGKPHAFCDAHADGILPGHTIKVSGEEFTEAGRHQNAAKSYNIFDENGQDVTDIYSVDCVSGIVDISRRPITVGAEGKEVVYSGFEQVYDEWELYDDTTLAEGQEILLTNCRTEKNVGNYLQNAKVSVFEGERDVTSNYVVTRKFSEFTILPRKVGVKTDSSTFEYDGAEHSFDEVTVSEDAPLINGHTLKVTSPFVALSAGNYVVEPKFEIRDENDENVTENYYIEKNFGDLTVQKCKISVSTTSFEAYYSGEDNAPALEGAIVDFESILKGEDSFLISYSQNMTAANENGYSNAPEIQILDKNNNDASANYEVEFSYGNIVVHRRTLYIETFGGEFEYDGSEKWSEGYELKDADEISGLANGEEEFLRSHTTVRNFSIDGVKNELTFGVRRGAVDTTDNYIFEMTFGILAILKKPLFVSTKGATKVYDGIPLTCGEIEVEGLALLSHTTTFERGELPEQTVVGTRENRFDFSVKVFEDGVDVSENYDVDYENATFGTLEITARPATITSESSDSVIYDGLGHVFDKVESDVVSGHVVKATFAEYIYAGIEYENAPDEGWSILDESGEDVTGNYAVTWQNGKIILQKRRIKVQTRSNEQFVYDGEDKSVEAFDVQVSEDNLPIADGDELTVVYKAFRGVGTYQNEPVEWSLRRGEEDVASNYIVTWGYGSVNILPRAIKVRTHSLEVVYDGENKSARGFELVEEEGKLPLANGESLSLTYGEWKVVGEHQNKPDFKIFVDESGEETTTNYSVEWEYGVVIITARKLDLFTDDCEIVYDGEWHSFDEIFVFEETSLVDGHKIVVTSPHKEIDAGEEYLISPTYEIHDESGEDVTKNYAVTLTPGKLKISKRAVSIQTTSFDELYMGQDLAPANDAEKAIENALNLLVGHDVFKLAYDVQMIDAGEYQNAPTIDILRDGASVKDKNYIVEISSYGTINVKKRDLYAKISDMRLEYNAKEQGAGELEFEQLPKGDWLASGEKLSVLNVATLTECGSVDFDFSYLVTSALGDVTKNYDAHIENGSLTVYPKLATLRTGDKEKLYDGTPLSSDEVTAFGLISGHRQDVSVLSDLPELTTVGRLENRFDFSVKVFEGEKDVTKNYDIDYENVTYGTLEVKARELILSTDEMTITYDAQEHGFELSDVKVEGKGLPAEREQRLEIDFLRFVDAGDYYVVHNYIKVFDGEDDITSNYIIEDVRFGKITILRREVELTTNSAELVYNGSEQSAEGFGETNGSIVAGHFVVSLSDNLYKAFEEVGEYQNVPEEWQIVDGDGESVSDNYIISWAYGVIKIYPRPVTVQLGSNVNVLYDGSGHIDNKYTVESELDFAQIGQTMTVTCEERTIAGEYENVLHNEDSYVIKKANGNVVDHNNYDITFKAGKLVIRRRKITIGLKSSANWNWVYDGTSHVIREGATPDSDGGYLLDNTDFEVKAVSGDDGLIFVHSVLVVGCSNVVRAGEYVAGQGEFTYKFIVKNAFGQGRNVTDDYEIADAVAGTRLVIDKRQVNAKSASGTWVYDDTKFSSSATEWVEAENEGRGMLVGHTLNVLRSTEVSEITDVLAPGGKAYESVGFEDNVVSEFSITSDSGEDVTDCYDVVWTERGKLRVKSAIQVYVYSITKSYDGKVASLEDESDFKNYKIRILPPDIKESDVTIKLVGSLLKPGTLTLDKVTEDSRAASSVTVADGVYRIDFVGQQNVIEITPRKLTVTTGSAKLVKRGNPISGADYGYTVSGLLDEDELMSITVTGVLNLEDESALNTLDISSILIVNGLGDDVTDCYEVIVVEGTLSWIDEEKE